MEKRNEWRKRLDLTSYKQFADPKEVADWIASNYTQEQLDEFDMNKHIDAPIGDYKGSGFKRMNEIIRKGCVEADNTNFDIKGLQNQLLQTRIPESIYVTRFVTLQELLFLFKSTCFGKAVIYNSFLSTTLLKEYYAMDYIKKDRIAISLYIPEGTPGTYLPEVNPNYPEYEILLPYGMKIRRINIKQYCVEQ